MRMLLHLAPHAQACAIGDDLVVLDARADAYLCLPGGATRLGWRPDLRQLAVRDRETADELAAAGLVDAAPAAPWLRSPPPLPQQAAPAAPPERLSGRQRAALALAMADLAIGYRGRSFSQILAHARRPMRARGPDTTLGEDAARLLRALIWLPAPGKCLARSFVLLLALRRCGHACDWVFGVRTWPFGAHCWLQSGDLVLDDVPERLVAYRPIGAA